MSLRHNNTDRSNWLLLITICVLVFTSACVPADSISVDRVSFNPALRPDQNEQRVEPAERGPASTYSMGRTLSQANDRKPLVSELYPIPPGFHEDDVLERFLRQLRRSQYYWSAVDEKIRLSWEVVVENVRVDGVACSISNIGACELRDPISRQRLVCNGRSVDWWETPPDIALSLQRCSLMKTKYNEPQQTESGCIPLDGQCGFDVNHPQHLHYPFCQFHCPFDQFFSGTYRLIVTAGGAEVARKVLLPSVVKVPHSAELARAMTRVEESDNTFSFEWSVSNIDGNRLNQQPENGLWKENFSPGLRNSRVRIFAETGRRPVTRRYLRPNTITITSVSPTAGVLLNPTTCDPDPGLLEFSPRSCAALGDMNPTYRYNAPENRLVWTVEVPRTQDGWQVTEEDRLFIEFTVVSTGSGESALAVRCPTNTDRTLQCLELGHIPADKESRFPNRFRLENVGSRPITITAIRPRIRNFRGTTGEFGLEFPGGGSLPLQLFGGTDIPVTVVARPAGSDELQTFAFIDFLDGNRQSQTLSIGITAQAYVSMFDLIPSSLEFDTEQRKKRAFGIGNMSPVDAQIFGAQLVGAHPSAFHILRRPVSFPVNLPPGESEFFQFEYNPVFPAIGFSPQSGLITNTATFVIQTSGGEQRIELTGRARFQATANPRRPMLRLRRQ